MQFLPDFVRIFLPGSSVLQSSACIPELSLCARDAVKPQRLLGFVMLSRVQVIAEDGMLQELLTLA